MSSIYGGQFPSYVTTSTDQIIKGVKTFTRLLTCEDGLETSSIRFGDGTLQLTAFRKLVAGTYTSCQIVVDVFGAIQSIISLPSTAVPTGTISMFGGTTAPAGYVLCDGARYAGTNPLYQQLYVAISINYSFPPYEFPYFNVPDLRGVYPGMPGINILCKSQDSNLNSGLFSGPSSVGRYQYQSTTVIPHIHTAEYPADTSIADRSGVGIERSYYQSGASQQNNTSGVLNSTAPNSYTNLSNNIRPLTLGVNYIIKL